MIKREDKYNKLKVIKRKLKKIGGNLFSLRKGRNAIISVCLGTQFHG